MEDLIKIRDLTVRFYTYEGVVHAINDLDLDIRRGETLGIVGETGSGKTMTALAILRLIPYPGRIESGSVSFFDKSTRAEVELLKLTEDRMRSIRGNKISMVFQEPGAALNPVYTIGDQISEVFLLHRRQELGRQAKQRVDNLLSDGSGSAATLKRPFWHWQSRLYNKIAEQSNPLEPRILARLPLFRRLLWRLRDEARLRTVSMLKDVEIPDPGRVAVQYPHNLSGGMKQRAVIAMALACSPELLIADEPTTSLDVTIQAQMLELFRRIKVDKGASVLFITHNLGVASEVCDRVAVMYAGRLCEVASVEEMFLHPLHPYTKALLDAVPMPGKKLQTIPGALADALNPPPGCRFHPRCPSAMPNCQQERAKLKEVSKDHIVACHLF
ncbi:MAG: ABC transporter ATP-binding protein [Dehalococcoidia bacterium]|nr:ABC transporter ATP-binding protein [Dehalococcoidia bacterium]MDH4366878.1 ABC transporter ATP-binding protein [Dehalococcoidia bacterium]